MTRFLEQHGREQESHASFERWLSVEFPRQYEIKTSFLKQIRLIEELPELRGTGIVDMCGVERPFPAAEEIQRELRREPEKYDTWLKRGFASLEITPFGLPLEKIASVASQRILDHHGERGLFLGTEPLSVNEVEPVQIWEKLLRADVSGEMKYLMSQFGDSYGYTKQQILNLSQLSFPGYRLYLREDDLHIPREGHGEVVGDRKKIEANRTASEYLHSFLEEGTNGLTPEDFLTMFILHLEETNEVIDNLDTDSGGFCVAAYRMDTDQRGQSLGGRCYCGVPIHEPNGHIPDAYWNRELNFLQIGGGPPNVRTPRIGARPIVEIGRTPPVV